MTNNGAAKTERPTRSEPGPTRFLPVVEPVWAMQRLRYDHGRGCLASPAAMAQLREWRAGYVVPDGACQDCGHPIADHDHDGCTNGCIRPTIDALAGCLCMRGRQ